MTYARWAEKKELKNILTAINYNSKIEKSGIPLMYDEENLYINDNKTHSLVIGSHGSGKTQSIILPMTKLAMKAGESLIINDRNGDIYKQTATELEKQNYKVIVLDFANPLFGNCWNPLSFPYTLYKNGEKDKAMELIENVAYYIFTEKGQNTDPFWVNSTIDYFVGLTLYLFENAKKEEINLNSIFAIASELNTYTNKDSDSLVKGLMDNLDKSSNIYINLSGTLLAPPETKGSIHSVFNQKIKTFISREKLSKMISNTDFEIEDIGKEKTALFIISGSETYSDYLIPMLVNQLYYSVDLFGEKKKTINILLDEFETLLPIKNFAKTINNARGIDIKFTVIINSYTDLNNSYGKENAEILKMCFGNIVYFIANDIYTLQEISNLCGNQLVDSKIVPLITIEELKMMKTFEAVVLIPRTMPIKTKMLPDYQIKWDFNTEPKEIPLMKDQNISIFNIKNTIYI